jgi:hypothetical protein
MAIGMQVVGMLVELPSQGLGGASWQDLAIAVAWLLPFAIVGAIVSWGVLWCVRALRRTVEQDGDLCWRCAYPMGSARITVCPECGTPVDVQRFSRGWLHRSVAVGRRAGWVVALTCVVAAFVLVHQGPIGRPTGSQQPATLRAIEPVFMVGAGSTLRPDLHGCVGAVIPGRRCTGDRVRPDVRRSG